MSFLFQYDPIPVEAAVNEAAEIPAFVFAAIACDRDSFPHNIVRYRWFYDAEYCKFITHFTVTKTTPTLTLCLLV